MLKKIFSELTDSNHWSSLYNYARSGDIWGLSTQFHWFLMRQKKRKPVVKINPAVILPAYESWSLDRPLVSVIIPCYNYGNFVIDAVNSVLDQHFQDFEIILIDGGSTDGSDKIVGSINHPKIRTFLRQGRHFLGDNRNFGIDKALGKYVCCLDADDQFTPDYLLKLVFLLETTNLDVVGTAKKFFGGINRIYHGPVQPVFSDCRNINPICVASIYSKKMWETIGPFKDFGQGEHYIFEDWEFWFRAGINGARFYMIAGEALFLHRVHGISMSRNTTIKPRSFHASYINSLHKDKINPFIIQISKDHQNTVYERSNSLHNLLRHPVTTSTPPLEYYKNAERFLPVQLQPNFLSFLKMYFSSPK